MDKNILRKEMLEKRSSLSEDFVRQASASMTQAIFTSYEWKKAGTIMLYCDYKNEPQTEDLIRAALAEEKTVVLPYTDPDFKIIPYILPAFDDRYFRVSPLGIREPNPETCEAAAPAKLDLILFPGVVFDINGNRIGFGKGCYDRFFAELSRDIPRWALAYDFQILDRIPAEKTDIPASAFVTETGIRNIYLNFCGLSI